MSFSQFVAILKARWPLMATVLATIVAIALLVSILLPRQFSATASVMVDLRAPDALGNGQPLQGLAAQSYVATQVSVIQSMRVAEGVVQSLAPATKDKLQEIWTKKGSKGEFTAWVAKFLLEGLTVAPERDTNVIAVSYKAQDPAFAADMANAFVKSYLETTITLRTQPAQESTAFLHAQAKQVREKLEVAQSRLSDFQQANGIAVSDERIDAENSRLTTLMNELVQTQAIGADAGSRAAAAKAGAGGLQEVINSPVVAQLRAELQTARTNLGGLRERMGEAHPQVIEARRRVDEVQARLNEETARMGSSVTVNNNVVQSRIKQLQAMVDQQRERVLKIKAARGDAEVLLRDVESAQKSYDAVTARLNQTTIESQSGQRAATSLERAVEPIEPASPKPRLILAAAVFAGTLLAVMAAIMREMMDRRVRVHDEVAALINQPLIGVVPAFNKTQSLGIGSKRLAISGPGAAKSLPAP